MGLFMKNKTSISDLINNNKAEAILIVLGSIFYIFMMCFRLTHSPLWFDEYIEHQISQMSIKSGEMYQNIIVTFQPPLYNFVMHFWLRIATNVLWFRLFNVLLGLVVGVCIYLTVKRLIGYKPAFFALVLLSCCYQYIYCVQECSEYQLMVMFISLTIYFYVRTIQDNSQICAFLFVLFAVCAMYSQYGAMFMVIPFLTLFYFQVLFGKNKKNILLLTILYGIAAFGAALPLYLLYASHQLIENAIAEHTTIHFGLSQFTSLFTEAGRILGYLFNIPVNTFTQIVLGALSVLYIISSIYIIRKYFKTDENVKASLLLVLLFGYVLHYFLVIFQVYAMVHPGQSGGFYARYSYFYIPLVIVSMCIITIEIKRTLIDNKRKNVRTANTVILAIFAVMAVLLFIPNITKNWHKAYDDIFADTWVENRGWEVPTYLIGQASYGFNHYIRDVYGDAACANVFHESQFNMDMAPDSFWIWRTSWGGDAFDAIVMESNDRGYNVTIYYDYGTEGQLAYVTK